jgi:hypothetical protein
LSNDDYRWNFRFTLSEECRFVEIKEPPNIELKINTDKDGMRSVREFIITVKSFTEEEALDKAKIQAKRLADILAALSAKHLRHNLEGYTRYDPDGSNKVGSTGKILVSFTGRYNIESLNSVDLSQSKVVQLVKALKPEDKIHRLEERLNHINNGLEAAENELYEVMIKEFYLAIANQPIARRYDPLRHVLSHY